MASSVVWAWANSLLAAAGSPASIAASVAFRRSVSEAGASSTAVDDGPSSASTRRTAALNAEPASVSW